jgi:argininosuccinate lyase
MGLLTALKGLPLSYNRDLQEDKRFVFDSADTVTASLKIMAGFLSTMKFRRDRMADAADKDLTLLATDLADVLVKEGMPFRNAHEIIGSTVRYCLGKGKRLQDLTDPELKRFSKMFPDGVGAGLSVFRSVQGKKAFGGTSPKNVVRQTGLLKKHLADIRKRALKLRG